MLYKIIDSWNAPYIFSAIAQVIGTILAITLTFRIILSQRLKYRFPLKISGILSKFEIVYFFSGVFLTLLSLIFLMIDCVIASPFIVAVTIIWMGMLYVYYRKTASSLSLEKLLEKAKRVDEESLRIWGEKYHGAISKRPKLVLYDIATQAVDQKDFQYMEDALAYLIFLPDRFESFIVRDNIGVLLRQYIDNSRVFESCMTVYYHMISPTAAGIKTKTYFFDEEEEKEEYDTPEMYVNNIAFRASLLFSEKKCSQVAFDLEELSIRHFPAPVGARREKQYMLKDILSAILSALVDFECLQNAKTQVDEETQNSHNKSKNYLINLLIKFSSLFGDEMQYPLLEVVKDLSKSLNSITLIQSYPDVKGREFWQKAGEYESSIRKKTAKSLAILLRERLLPKYGNTDFFDMVERFLTTTEWWSEEGGQ